MSRATLQVKKIVLSCKLCIVFLLALSAYGGQALQGQSCQPTSCPTTDDCSYSDVGPRTNIDTCKYPDTNGCPADQQANAGCCSPLASPIIFDLDGKGFHLSSLENGVWFRVYPNKKEQYKVGWPEKGAQNAWLVLDRNGNGTIDDFSELFGDETPQPKPSPGKSRNGFAALAVYDSIQEGGNEDGWITKEDAIFSRLRVWRDDNHDGVSQPTELLTLDQVGITAIALQYRRSSFVDANGNVFRYRSILKDEQGDLLSKIIYDVYVLVGGPHAQAEVAAHALGREWPDPAVTQGFTSQ